MSRPSISIALATALMAAAGALAQESLAPETGESELPLPRYQIELIVFAHTDGDPNEEVFDTDVVPPSPPLPTAALDPGSPLLTLEALEARRSAFGDPSRSPPGRSLGGPPDAEPERSTAPGQAAELRAPAAEPLEPAGAAVADSLEPGDAGADDPFEFIDPFGTLADDEPGAIDPAGEPAPEPRVRFLRPDELTLGDADRVLSRLGAYRVLAHGGWIQDGLDEANAEPVNLSYLGTTNPRGTVTLYLGRFLHVALDLFYEVPPPGGTAAPGPAPGSLVPGGSAPGALGAGGISPGAAGPGGRAFAGRGLSEVATPRWYELKAERNAIRSGELHYIDHPLLGVLVLVTPAPEETEVLEDDTAVLAPAA